MGSVFGHKIDAKVAESNACFNNKYKPFYNISEKQLPRTQAWLIHASKLLLPSRTRTRLCGYKSNTIGYIHPNFKTKFRLLPTMRKQTATHPTFIPVPSQRHQLKCFMTMDKDNGDCYNFRHKTHFGNRKT